jgi:hypothetical protein
MTSLDQSATFADLLDIAKTGIPPGKEDPIDEETADEAFQRYLETGVINPFHADTIQSRAEHHEKSPLQ